MEAEKPTLTFPVTFCCNCGDRNCEAQVQETRVWRFFGIKKPDTTFHLDVPVCAGCRRSTKRRPAGFFSRLAVLVLITGTLFGICIAVLSTPAALPLWIGYFYGGSVFFGIVLTWLFYRFRRPTPPQTSFYQPVRIKEAKLQFAGLMAGAGQVGFMKLAFTNPDYLNEFVSANQEAIKAKHVSAVKA